MTVFENLSLGHLAVVLVIVLLLFGAKRIPEIAGSLGKGINQFKKAVTDPGSGDVADEVAVGRSADGRVGQSTGAMSVQNVSSSAAAAQASITDAEREPKRLIY